MNASQGESRKYAKNRGVAAKCSSESRSPGSMLVALWGNVAVPTVLICNDTGAKAWFDPLRERQTHESGKVYVGGLSDRRSAKIIPSAR
jgi:hypothetical protein